MCADNRARLNFEREVAFRQMFIADRDAVVKLDGRFVHFRRGVDIETAALSRPANKCTRDLDVRSIQLHHHTGKKLGVRWRRCGRYNLSAGRILRYRYKGAAKYCADNEPCNPKAKLFHAVFFV